MKHRDTYVKTGTTISAHGIYISNRTRGIEIVGQPYP